MKNKSSKKNFFCGFLIYERQENKNFLVKNFIKFPYNFALVRIKKNIINNYKKIELLGIVLYKRYYENKYTVQTFFQLPFKLGLLKIYKSNQYKKIRFIFITLYRKTISGHDGIGRDILGLPFRLYFINTIFSKNILTVQCCRINLFKIKLKNNIENDIYKEFIDSIYYKNSNRKETFVSIADDSFERRPSDTKVIAYYLPQFYRIPLNDKYHGMGFTEWTNSSQAIPMYIGHEQPHIPYDVGYYDLLNPNTLKRQSELAAMYGIYGFCFHWYWFSGKRIMEKPLELLLSHPDIDIKYCFNWATENWTALWDGGNKEVMFVQELKDGDDLKLFNDLLPYFKDERYIKIDNKPLFSIYNLRIFEKQTTKNLIINLKKYAIQAGFNGLYVTGTNFSDFDEDVAEWGADALNEFPPNFFFGREFKPKGFLYPFFKGYIHDGEDLINRKVYLRKYKSKKYFRSAMVSWDNTARKGYSENCGIFHGLNPSTFKIWLDDIVKESKQIHKNSEDIVFVNSWNEWAEGSHLEPCMRYGYGYLQAVKDVLEKNRTIDNNIVVNKIKKNSKKPLKFYIHCIESFGDIVACEPIARWVKDQAPQSCVIWIAKKQYRQLLSFNPNINDIIEVDCLSQSTDICNSIIATNKGIVLDCHYDGRICSKTGRIHYNKNNIMVNEKTYFNYGAILESFCLCAGMPALTTAPMFWLDPKLTLSFTLPKKYIVLHCKSAEKVKDWDDRKWNTLAQNLIYKGFNVVEIGQKKTIYINNSQYYDLTKNNSFQELAAVIKNASFFCSVDSGFAHIANCFKIPSCILIGKYKTFDFPFPYTGFFAQHKDFILYSQNGSVCEISEKDVEQKILAFQEQFNYENSNY